MTSFTYYQPTEIRFGRGRVREVGAAVASLGDRCLLVTGRVLPARSPHVETVMRSLREAGVEVTHFAGAVPNPTTESVSAGATAARAAPAIGASQNNHS